MIALLHIRVTRLHLKLEKEGLDNGFYWEARTLHRASVFREVKRVSGSEPAPASSCQWPRLHSAAKQRRNSWVQTLPGHSRDAPRYTRQSKGYVWVNKQMFFLLWHFPFSVFSFSMTWVHPTQHKTTTNLVLTQYSHHIKLNVKCWKTSFGDNGNFLVTFLSALSETFL